MDEQTGQLQTGETANEGVERALHKTIAKVGGDIERLSFNTAIAAMIEFVNEAIKSDGLTRDQMDRFVRVLAPFAPHVGEELWSRLDMAPPVSLAEWPGYDEAMLTEDSVEIAVQINGKVRHRIRVPADADKAKLEEIAMGDAKVGELIKGKTVRKVIAVPGRMVNIVAN